MFEWLTANIGTILTLLAVILLVIGVVRVMINDKKQGRSTCGSRCGACAMHGRCPNAK